MDTQATKNTIVALKASIDSQIEGLTAQSEALSIAVQIIDNTLETQAIELDNKYKQTISTLEQGIATVAQELETKEQELEAISTQKETLERTLSDKELEIEALKVSDVTLKEIAE